MKIKKSFSGSPALIIGLLIILLPVFIVMTADRIQRQKKLVQQQMMEKAVSLIRTFEAGARAGMFNMRWGAKRIQTLLAETAQQPDVAYIMITAKDGRILSHSDENRIGEKYDGFQSFDPAADQFERMNSRIVDTDGSQPVFEVYKRFVPIQPQRRGHMRRYMMRMKMEEILNDPNAQMRDAKDWSRVYHDFDDRFGPGEKEHYIFAGLSTAPMNTVESQLFRQTVFQSTLYFLFICAGIAAVVTFQSYRSARSSLKQVQDYSKTVIQNMPSGLITTDLRGRVTAMNDAATGIFGRALDHVPKEFETVMGEVKEHSGISADEIAVALSGDKNILLDLNASLIRDELKNAIGILFLFKDMTQIKELTRQVETNRRLAAIGKLAAGVAHEIRNPLSSIKGFAAYFEQRYKDTPSDRDTARVMASEVERINRSITQLLEFAKPMAVDKQWIGLKPLLDHSLKLIEQDVAAKKIRVDLDMTSGLERIFTDGDRLNQVLLNLYMNALDALDENGKLLIRVLSAPLDCISIEVADDGCGMDKETVNRIFDPYFTTRPTGTGLGLAIVHRIIENLGGRIRVESEPGRGTSFVLTIPAGENKDAAI